MGAVIDLTGQVFGRLTVLHRAQGVKKKGRAAWECRCECGNTKVVIGKDLRNGKTKSCGCLRGEQFRQQATHGHCTGARTREYKAWQAMKKRCLYPKAVNYADYGGRGIRVHEPWINSFEQFLEDMGPAPTQEYSIDRINPDGHYEPGNTRWASRLEQANNKRNSRFITYRGETMTLAQWSSRFGLNSSTLSDGIKRWGTMEEYMQSRLRKDKAEKEDKMSIDGCTRIKLDSIGLLVNPSNEICHD